MCDQLLPTGTRVRVMAPSGNWFHGEVTSVDPDADEEYEIRLDVGGYERYNSDDVEDELHDE